jgi:hypothetical protein
MSSGIWVSLGVFILAAMPIQAQAPGPDLDLYRQKNGPPINKLDRYLTREGFLTAPLDVRDEEKGFGVFFGRVWRIEPDGSWTATEIHRNQTSVRGQGKLTKKDLVKLAMALAEADPLTLTNQGRRLVNPHVTTIIYGGNKAERTYGVDRKLKPVDPEEPLPVDPLVPAVNQTARYSAVLTAVRTLIEPNLPQEVRPKRVQ